METSSKSTEAENVTGHHESLLNLSPSQLVQIMSCALKRSHEDTSPIQAKRQCLPSPPQLLSELSCSSPTYQELVRRNRYLEGRVKHLETLNYNLQYGLMNVVRETVAETLEAQIRMGGITLHTPNSNEFSPSQPDEQISWQDTDRQDASALSDVTSTTTKIPDVCDNEPAPGCNTSQDNGGNETHHTHAYIPSPVMNINSGSNCGEGDSSQGYQAQTLDAADILPTRRYEIIRRMVFRGGKDVTLGESKCQNQIVTSSNSNDRLVGMAKEIQVIVRESTNYKKLTNRLLNALFEREELACSTLTGKSKLGYGKEKLDEDTVNLIVEQAVSRFPGTSPSDVRVVISQNCKDKALRLHRKQLNAFHREGIS